MFDSDDPRIEQMAIPADRADRWTLKGVNSSQSRRRRIDIGTSLGNFGDDRDDFLKRSAETHRLFDDLFSDRSNPIQVIYDHLRQIAPARRVVTAYEPDGRQYGPAIFRIHYGGYTYAPHYDSVRNRECRTDYSVYQYDSQLAGVLCIQNSIKNGMAAQGIVHRQQWSSDVDPYLKSGRFHEYAAEHSIEHIQVDLEPGDLYFFNTGMIHEVPGGAGNLPRVVLATFIGYSDDNEEVMVWS